MLNQTTARISVFIREGPSTQYRALSQTCKPHRRRAVKGSSFLRLSNELPRKPWREWATIISQKWRFYSKERFFSSDWLAWTSKSPIASSLGTQQYSMHVSGDFKALGKLKDWVLPPACGNGLVCQTLPNHTPRSSSLSRLWPAAASVHNSWLACRSHCSAETALPFMKTFSETTSKPRGASYFTHSCLPMDYLKRRFSSL